MASRITYVGLALGLVAVVLTGTTVTYRTQDTSKSVSVQTRSGTFEGTLEREALYAALSFDGKKERYFFREAAQHGYLISHNENGYCFQIDGNTLLQMPGASTVCKRNN